MQRALLILAAALYLLQPAFAEEDKNHDGGKYRQEELFDARRQGNILPLSTILDSLRDRGIVDVLEIENEYEHGRAVYEIYYLDSEGRRGEIHVDAATGRFVDSGDED
jgi:uncharacterized membrane protein YkoI